MEIYLDPALIAAARVAARRLLESGEVRVAISGLDFDPSAEFLILRELTSGIIPLGRFKEGDVVFYICGETRFSEGEA